MTTWPDPRFCFSCGEPDEEELGQCFECSLAAADAEEYLGSPAFDLIDS